MFDISTVSKRYFEIKIGSIKLEVEPPKIKALKKIMAISKSADNDSMDELANAIKMILDKNKTNYKVPDKIIDELDFDQMTEILTAYFEWLKKNKNDPN